MSETAAPTTADKRRVIRLTAGSHFLVHLFEGAVPPLIPLLVVTFETNYFTMGIIVTVSSYLFGFGALPAGFLASRIGPRNLVTGYLFLTGVAFMLILGVESLLPYGVLVGVAGLTSSVYHPAANTLISYAVKEKGRAFGLHGITGSLGTAAVPVLTAAIASGFGWQAPHVVYGVLGVMLGVYSLKVREYRVAAADAQPAADGDNTLSKARLVGVVTLIVSGAALGLAYRGIITFLPSYMGEHVQIGLLGNDAVTIGGFVTTLALLSGAVGQYIAGKLVDRYSPERLYLGVVAAAGILVLLIAGTTGTILVGVTVVFALFNFATQPLQNYLLSHYMPSRHQGAAFGIHFFAVFGVGSLAAAIAGYIADTFGLEAVFFAMAVCFAVATVLAASLVAFAGRIRAA
ncbi:MAG: MFS transporter [Spirochaetales bacterium]